MRHIFLSLCFILCASRAHADWVNDYVRYEALPELGKISISAHAFSGGDNMDTIDKQWQRFADKNIFLPIAVPGGVSRSFVRHEALMGMEVKTVVTVGAPLGSGPCGALGGSSIKVFVNDKQRLDIGVGSGRNSDCYGYPEIYSVDILAGYGLIRVKSISAGALLVKDIYIKSDDVLTMDSFGKVK